MIIRNEQQALCIAVEMERRAVRVYERALMITSDPAVCRGIRDILKDEQEHLRRFTAMKADYPAGEEEEKLLLQALASEMLFPRWTLPSLCPFTNGRQLTMKTRASRLEETIPEIIP